MKKILCALVALTMLASLIACGAPKAKEEPKTPTDANQQTPNAPEDKPTSPNATAYNDRGIKFDVPKAWQQTFKGTYFEQGSGNTAFTVIEFTCKIGTKDVKVMSIACFGKSQWDTLKANNKDAERMKLGESKDKSHVYTLRVEDEIQFDSASDTKTYSEIRSAALKLKDKIEITD
ncbi:MAG: hypothetical protein RSA70_02635 [Clostridia bacterium]